jgi:thiol-disulfide isomerase/thioredoxin
MKAVITLVFVAVAAGFLFLVFKGGYFSSNPVVVQKVEQGVAGSAILEQLSALELRDYKGSKQSISKEALLGPDKVVIHLWASWCAPCVNEVPELIEYSKQNPAVKFVIVSEDDYNDDIAKFMKSFPDFDSDKFTRIWDADKKVSSLLKIDRLPMSFLIQKGKAEPRLVTGAANWKNLNF